MILLWMVKQKSENSRIECVCLQSSWSVQNHNNCAGFFDNKAPCGTLLVGKEKINRLIILRRISL